MSANYDERLSVRIRFLKYIYFREKCFRTRPQSIKIMQFTAFHAVHNCLRIFI